MFPVCDCVCVLVFTLVVPSGHGDTGGVVAPLGDNSLDRLIPAMLHTNGSDGGAGEEGSVPGPVAPSALFSFGRGDDGQLGLQSLMDHDRPALIEKFARYPIWSGGGGCSALVKASARSVVQTTVHSTCCSCVFVLFSVCTPAGAAS
jgi:hypothetical protein